MIDWISDRAWCDPGRIITHRVTSATSLARSTSPRRYPRMTCKVLLDFGGGE